MSKTPLIIKERTPFKSVQQYYPDAIKGVFITNEPMEYIQQGMMQIYHQLNMPENYAKCLYWSRKGLRNGYKNVYIFSQAEAGNVDFRFHAGSLTESLKSCCTVTSLAQLRAVIEQRFSAPIVGELEFNDCRWDDRINWLTYLVVGTIARGDRGVIGMSNGRFLKD